MVLVDLDKLIEPGMIFIHSKSLLDTCMALAYIFVVFTN